MTGSMASRRSNMPEANKMARMLRTGRTKSDLASRYSVTTTAIALQLAANGWHPETGEWVGGRREADTGAPLSARGDGAGTSGHYVGGGDNPNVVPTTTRPFTQRPKPRGLAWPDRGDAPAAMAPRRHPTSESWSTARRANGHKHKLNPEQETEMAKRYLDGESSVDLGRIFGVNDRTVRKRLASLGVPLRTRGEALKLRYQQTQDRKVASGWIGITKDVA